MDGEKVLRTLLLVPRILEWQRARRKAKWFDNLWKKHIRARTSRLARGKQVWCVQCDVKLVENNVWYCGGCLSEGAMRNARQFVESFNTRSVPVVCTRCGHRHEISTLCPECQAP